MAQEILDSGKALKKMNEIIKLQGGKLVQSSEIPVGEYCYDFKSKIDGKVVNINNHAISRVARFAGAPKDNGAGIYLYVHEKDRVKKGDKLLTIHAENKDKLRFAKNLLLSDGVVEVK